MVCRQRTTKGPDPPQSIRSAAGGYDQQLTLEGSEINCTANFADSHRSAEEGNLTKWFNTVGGCTRQSKISSRRNKTFNINSNPLLLLVVILCLITKASADPDCSTVGHAGGSDGSGGCLCQSYYVWTPGTISCQLDCSQVLNSTGVSMSQIQCVCIAGTVWDITTYSCA